MAGKVLGPVLAAAYAVCGGDELASDTIEEGSGMTYRNRESYVLGWAAVGQAPAASGVYTIFSSRAWVYVGESDNIQQTLYRHLNELAPCLNGFGPLSFSFELVNGPRRMGLWQSLVAQLKPTCNQVLDPLPASRAGYRDIRSDSSRSVTMRH